MAATFLSVNSPFLLPAGEELEARRAHHTFRDPLGDFVSYQTHLRGLHALRQQDAGSATRTTSTSAR